MTDEEQLRKQAKARLKSQQAFKTMLGGFVVLWIICWVIWALSKGEGDSGYWPVWVMFGTGIAALYSGWNAYGPRNQGISDAAVDREVKKMKD